MESTQRILKNAVAGRNYMSDNEEEKEQEKQPKTVEKTDKSSIAGGLGNKRQREKAVMHGATVVPEPAFMKHRKLLEKKKTSK